MKEYRRLEAAVANDKFNSEYVALIFGGENEIIGLFNGCSTEKHVSFLDFKNPSKFVADIPKVFKKIPIKAVILILHGKEKNLEPYKNNYEFCAAARDQLEKVEIPYYFIGSICHSFETSLIASNVISKFGESIVMVIVDDDGIAISELRYGIYGYEYISYDIGRKAGLVPHDYIRRQILGRCNPTKIFLSATSPGLRMMDILRNKILESEADKVIAIECSPEEFNEKFAVECAKWICDRGYTRFHIIPKIERKYCIGYISGEKKISKFMVDEDQSLPLEETYLYTVGKSCIKHFVGYFDRKLNEFVVIETFNLVPGAKYTVTLKIDANNFVSYSVEQMCNDEIRGFLELLNKNFKSSIPVIGLSSNFSVICVNQNGEFAFFKAWNGICGKPLFISFDLKKPKYCEAAFKVYDSYPSAVTWDILSIMSKSPENITVQKSWGFSIDKDSENPVLLEFDNFDGTRKAASPSFLMALLIKEHLKSIEKEIGERPKEISFYIFENNGCDRIKKGIEEACKLLEVKCSFIKFDVFSDTVLNVLGHIAHNILTAFI